MEKSKAGAAEPDKPKVPGEGPGASGNSKGGEQQYSPIIGPNQAGQPRSALHKAARTYAQKGWPVFPLVAGTKTPATAHGFHDASSDLAQIDAWWEAMPDANIAFQPQRAGLAVIDADDYGVESKDALAVAEIEHGSLPETYTVRTARGGRHLYYLGDLPPSQSIIAPHVDTRGAGSYAVLAPSVFEGGTYTVEKDIPPVALPEWPGAVIAAARRVKSTALVDELDLPHAISRAQTYLKNTAPPAIEGQNGDLTTYKVACVVLNLGVSEDKAFELMEEWNARCEPPWEDDDLRAKISNAATYMQNEAGSWTAPPMEEQLGEALAAVFARQPEPNAGGPETGEGFLTLADLLAMKPKPVEELVQGLIEKRRATFLVGPGGVHKSRLALQWGLSIAAAKPVWGRAVEAARFIFLSYEDDLDEVLRRAHAMASRLEVPADSPVEYWNRHVNRPPLAKVSDDGQLTVQEFGQEFIDHLAATPGHKFVVIDSTYNAIHFAGRSKIDEGAVMGAIGWLESLCAKTDSSLVLLWHPSQAGQERDDASGWSVAWTNAPRAKLSLTRQDKSDDAFQLKVAKRNHGPKGEPVTLHFDRGVLNPVGALADGGMQKKLETVARIATMAAETGLPINGKSHLFGWMFDEFEREIGFKPTARAFRELLGGCGPAELLRYQRSTRHKMAGFYPWDEDKARELAVKAKKKAAQSVGLLDGNEMATD